MKQKYKDELIKKTEDNYKHLIRQKEDIQNAIKERLNTSFNDYFGGIKSSDENKNSIRFNIDFENNLLSVITLLEQKGDCLYLDRVWEAFIRKLIEELCSISKLDLIDRNKNCKEDSELRNVIKNSNYNLLIGNTTIFQCMNLDDINKYYEHEKFMNSLKKIEILESANVLAINDQDIKIHLNEIIVNMVPPTEQKIEEYNEYKHIFTTQEQSGIVIFHEFSELRIYFKENEFWDFFKHYMQNIAISIEVSMEVKKTENNILATVFK